MSWINKRSYASPHTTCNKPRSEGKHFGVGSIWQCDECHTQWRFVSTRYEGDQRDSYWNDNWEIVILPGAVPEPIVTV